MRMELADNVTDGARGLRILGVCPEAQLVHGVNDAALHGFQAIADMRQCPVIDDIHRIVKICALGVFNQRYLFDITIQMGIAHIFL